MLIVAMPTDMRRYRAHGQSKVCKVDIGVNEAIHTLLPEDKSSSVSRIGLEAKKRQCHSPGSHAGP